MEGNKNFKLGQKGLRPPETPISTPLKIAEEFRDFSKTKEFYVCIFNCLSFMTNFRVSIVLGT